MHETEALHIRRLTAEDLEPLHRLLSDPAVRAVRAEVERRVLAGELTPAMAAQQILDVAPG